MNDVLPIGGKGGQTLARQAKPISSLINGSNCVWLTPIPLNTKAREWRRPRRTGNGGCVDLGLHVLRVENTVIYAYV
jgi:hypothetical protein